ncbi:MAG: glutathione S-transferase family protein [Wenzhouxiangellaceae bacterium]|nr:glutathione S-transferase family protein [Wenzhouxiangellaceae bacterium]
MHFYTCTGAPSPRRVTLYLAEKGIELETVEVDLKTGQHLSDEFQAKSPECTVPVLELDDGSCLWNSIAIRQYLESLHPEPPLLGRDALERARVTQYLMWIEHNGMISAAEAFRNAARGMADHALPGRRPVPQIEELVERGTRRFKHYLEDLDGFLAERQYLVGDAFTVADIDAMIMVDFGCRVTKAGLDRLDHLSTWYERIRSRPKIRAEG